MHAIQSSGPSAEPSRLLLEGHQLLLQSRAEDAAPLLLRALELYDRQADIPAEFVQALGDLASIATTRGDLNAAESFLQRALTLAHVRLGPDHPDVATILASLAGVYLRRSEFTKAEPVLQRLLEIKRTRGEEHPEVATVLASLATVHSALGAHELAEGTLRRVLAIRERTLAPNHFATMTTLEHLAESCAARGKVQEALVLLHRALAMRDRILGSAHPSMAGARTRIADLELLLSNEEFGSVPVLAPTVTMPLQVEVTPREAVATSVPLRSESSDVSEARPVAELRQRLYDEQYEWDDDFEMPARGALLNKLAAKAAPITAFARTPRGRVAVLAVAVTSLVSALVLATRTRADVVEARPTVRPVALTSVPSASAGPSEDARLASPPRRPQSLALATSPAARQRDVAPPSTSNERRTARLSSLEEGPGDDSRAVRLPNALRLRSLDAALTSAAIAAPPAPQIAVEFAPSPTSRFEQPVSVSPTASGGPGIVHAVLAPGNPAAEYPPDLLRRRVEGRVVAEFLVDVNGRVDPRTFRVVSSTNAQFTEAVRALLPNLRFLPAERGGVKTEEWVGMPFRFSAKPQ